MIARCLGNQTEDSAQRDSLWTPQPNQGMKSGTVTLKQASFPERLVLGMRETLANRGRSQPKGDGDLFAAWTESSYAAGQQIL